MIAFPEIDPVGLRVGPLAIRWYGVAYVSAFALAYFVLRRLAQRDCLDLARALAGAALAEYQELRLAMLSAAREFRRNLQAHWCEVEASAGLFGYIADAAPSQVECLRLEHREMDPCLGELERVLAAFDASADPSAEKGVSAFARRLAEIIRIHQPSACGLVLAPPSE